MTRARVGDQLHTLEAVQALPAGAVIVWHERDTRDTRAGVICRSLDHDGRIYSELSPKPYRDKPSRADQQCAADGVRISSTQLSEEAPSDR